MDNHQNFPGSSKVGALLRIHDWSASVLGDPARWPQSLRSIAQLILHSKFPMFLAWGPELGLLYNDAYAEILGNKHPRSLGARFQDVWEEIWSDISPIVNRALDGQSSYFENLPLVVERAGYKENAWFTFSYSPVYDDQGVIAGMYCSVVETTRIVLDRKLRQFQLSLADRLHPLTSPDAVAATAVEMLAGHLDASGSWYAAIDDAAGMFHTRGGWFEPNHPALPQTGKIDDFSPSLLQTLRTGQDFVCNDVTTDPRTREFGNHYLALHIGSILIVPVLRNGRLAFNINVTKHGAYNWTADDIYAAKDVVERRKAAEERQALLTSERAARAEAERLNRSKDEFLAMLAHELRNPLAPVSAAAEILRIAGNDPNRVRQVSDIISRQIGHFTHLIDDLMDVSRVTRGLIQLDTEALDMKAIINTAIEQVRPMIEARQHSLTTRMDADHATIKGDRTRLVQVIANLLTNATKFTPPRGEISLKVEANDEFARVVVTDNGHGIEASLLPHVFDLFTQGSRGLDRTQGGLGIGLALVKAIVALHHGDVQAFSNGAGAGSTFTVSIPRLRDEAAHSQEFTGNEAGRQTLCVMVVDDNLDAANSLSMLLTAIGHQVIVASNASDALACAQLEAIDAFILDIGLPDMTGYDLARALRGRPGLANKTYMALTGYGQVQDRELSRDAGFAHHFVKPVNNQLLFRALAGVSSRSTSAAL